MHKSADTTALTEHDSKINNIDFILLNLIELVNVKGFFGFFDVMNSDHLSSTFDT